MTIKQNDKVKVHTSDKSQAGFFNGMTGVVIEVREFGSAFMIVVEFNLEDDGGFYKDTCSFRPDELKIV